MKAAILGTFLTAVYLVSVGVASAGDYAIREGSNGTPAFYRHASTYEEGFLRGAADLWRGLGDYNYSTSLALINREKARSLAIDNKLKATEAYFEQRRINREAVREENGPRPTSQDAEKYAKMRAPKPLEAYQYEPALKTLFWPTALKTESFAAERDAVDKLIAERTMDNSGVGSHFHHEVTQLSNQMMDKLRNQIREMNPSEYIAAKRFLVGLEREAEMFADVDGLAVK